MSPTHATVRYESAGADRDAPADSNASSHLRAVPQPCTFSLLTTREDFDALKDEWNLLFDRSATSVQLFQSFGWCWHWCNNFLPTDSSNTKLQLAVLTARRNGKLISVWPLATERHSGLTHLVWMGAPVSQYGDILIDNVADSADILLAGWKHLIGALKPDVVWLSKVRADAAITPLFSALKGVVTRRERAPFMHLASSPDFESYMQRHSGRARKKHRAVARKLAAMGTVEFVREMKNSRASDLTLTAINEKLSQLLERGIVSPALSDPRTQKFFCEAAADKTNPSGVCVYAIEINGEAAAIDVLVKCKDRVATHIFAYSQKYAKDRVGAHLMELTIERSFDAGFHYFDMLAPADDYKLRWSDGTIDVIDWTMPLTAKGKLYTHAYLRTLRPALKRARDVLPPSIAKVVSAAYRRMHRLAILMMGGGGMLPPAT